MSSRTLRSTPSRAGTSNRTFVRFERSLQCRRLGCGSFVAGRTDRSWETAGIDGLFERRIGSRNAAAVALTKRLLPFTLEAPLLARRYAARYATAYDLHPVDETLLLIVSELVTN